MSKILKKLRIFVGSPSDVASERDKLEAVVNSLKPMADHFGFILEVLTWHNIIPDAGRPQQTIFNQLKPTEWDIFIGILWHRFGTPSNAINPQTNKPFTSGTEEEFVTAYNLWKQHGKPRIMMYRCTRSIPLNDVDPDQLKQVKDFFKLIQDPKSDYSSLTKNFDTTESFESLLRDNLQNLLIEYGEKSNIHIEDKTSGLANSAKTQTAPKPPKKEPDIKKGEKTGSINRKQVDVMKVDTKPEVIEKKAFVESSKSTLTGHPSPKWIAENKITFSNGMEFMLIPAGTFLMGNDDSFRNETPRHFVDIPYDYWMARFPLTNSLYNSCVVEEGILHPVKNWETKKIILLKESVGHIYKDT